jgi:S-formylglutathione hydrolase FrmB
VAVAALAGGAFASPASAKHLKGINFQVLLPPSYNSTERSWPVLYVIPGSGIDAREAIDFLDLRSYVARDQAIVVTASEDAGTTNENFFVDYFDGSERLDSWFVRDVIPWVDSHYRTLADGEHRGIVGFSAGGYSSTAIASRHPGMFDAVGTFSGVVDLRVLGPAGGYLIMPPLILDRGPGAFALWGDPTLNADNYRAQNPTDLARNLHGTDLVYLSAGNGRPSGPQEIAEAGAGLPFVTYAETGVSLMTADYDRALTTAHVRHVYTPHVGLHLRPHWLRDMARFWPRAMSAIGP